MALADDRITSLETERPSSRSRLRLVSCSMARFPISTRSALYLDGKGYVPTLTLPRREREHLSKFQTRPPEASMARVIAAAAASGSAADATAAVTQMASAPASTTGATLSRLIPPDGHQRCASRDGFGLTHAFGDPVDCAPPPCLWCA